MVDRVVGLEMGADDYITTPFSTRGLHARVKSVLRSTKAELVKMVRGRRAAIYLILATDVTEGTIKQLRKP